MSYSEPLNRHILKFRAKGRSCAVCGSSDIGLNVRNACYCYACHYGVSASKKVFRIIGHIDFSSLGRKIKKYHPDLHRVPPNHYC